MIDEQDSKTGVADLREWLRGTDGGLLDIPHVVVCTRGCSASHVVGPYSNRMEARLEVDALQASPHRDSDTTFAVMPLCPA